MAKEIIKEYERVYTLVEKEDYHEDVGKVIIPIGTKGSVWQKYGDNYFDVDFYLKDIFRVEDDESFAGIPMVGYSGDELSHYNPLEKKEK